VNPKSFLIPFLSILAACLFTTAAGAEETLPLRSVNKANEVIDAAIAAHGGAEKLKALNSLARKTSFVAYATQQSRGPNPPWDTTDQTSFSAIDYEKGMYVTRNEGEGGGFVFDTSTIIDGENGWQLDYRAGTAAPIAEPDFKTASGPFIRVTPALLLKELQQRRQVSHWLGVAEYNGRPHDVVTLVMEVGPGLSLYFDQETHMLDRMERVLPPFGQVEYRFEDYYRADGIAFNRSFKLLINGDLNLDMTNEPVQVNGPVGQFAQVPQDLREVAAVLPDDFNLQEIAEGVYLVGGNGAYGLVVEMEDYLVAIGGTQGAAARLEEVRKHSPDKPLRYGVLTHHHSDHVPGAADFASEGATIITFRENEDIVRAAAGDENVSLEFVSDRMTISDGGRTIELYDIGPTPHANHILVAWLPDEKILFEADHFPQPATGPLPPAVPATVAFAAAIAQRNLDFEKIVGAHSSRVGSASDLQSVLAADQTAGVGAR